MTLSPAFCRVRLRHPTPSPKISVDAEDSDEGFDDADEAGDDSSCGDGCGERTITDIPRSMEHVQTITTTVIDAEGSSNNPNFLAAARVLSSSNCVRAGLAAPYTRVVDQFRVDADGYLGGREERFEIESCCLVRVPTDMEETDVLDSRCGDAILLGRKGWFDTEGEYICIEIKGDTCADCWSEGDSWHMRTQSTVTFIVHDYLDGIVMFDPCTREYFGPFEVRPGDEATMMIPEVEISYSRVTAKTDDSQMPMPTSPVPLPTLRAAGLANSFAGEAR